MTEPTNKSIIEWVMAEALNTGNLTVIDQVGVDNLCVYYPQASAPLWGLEQVKHAFSQARAAFPDLYVMTEESIADSDHVVIRWTARATHTGTFWGIPPTRRLVTWSGVMIYRFVANMIAEVWIFGDALGLQQQLAGSQTPSRTSQ